MKDEDTATVGGLRFRLGAAIFVVGFLSPALIPLVIASNLPTAWKTGLSGFLGVGLPEIMMVVAAAVMGKAGFAELKRRFGRFLRKYGPPDTVGRTRYRIGLVMFSLPLLLGWLAPYLGGHIPGFSAHSLWWHISGDLTFVASFFVLGGDFWDKVRSLFVHEARAVVPGSPPLTPQHHGGRDEKQR